MPTVERDGPQAADVPSGPVASLEPTGATTAHVDWVTALNGRGPDQMVALRQLHALMLRACGHQVWRMRAALPDGSPEAVDVIVNQAADEAMTTLLSKLHTFEGRSRFTTWAYKFAILQAATEVRRLQWQHREVHLRDLDEPPAPSCDSPELQAEGTALADALAEAMRRVLTPYQRRIAVTLLVDGVPVDVLADRLGTSRGALYKTLHDARVRLRADLIAQGHLPAAEAPASPPTTAAAPAPTAVAPPTPSSAGTP